MMTSAIGVTPRQRENGSVPESTHPDSERSSDHRKNETLFSRSFSLEFSTAGGA